MKVELNVKQHHSFSNVIVRLAFLAVFALGFSYALLQVCGALMKAIK
jgi:hypothetical protein